MVKATESGIHKQVKPTVQNYHAKFDIYHIYGISQNCHVKVSDTLDTKTVGWLTDKPTEMPIIT